VTGSEHIVVASPGCVFSVPSTVSIAATGGTANIFVSTSPQNCGWTATSSDAFVTITSGASGTGSGTTSISVAPNTGLARGAIVTIGGVHVAVSQAGQQNSANCASILVPTSADYSAELKIGTLTVTVPTGCQWAASTSSSFISFNPTVATRTGNGSFTYTVFGNLTGAPRSGSITVGPQPLTITQHAALGGNSLSFVSDPGDYVGQGWTLLLESPTSTFAPSLDPSLNHVSFQIQGSDGQSAMFWSLFLEAPQGQQLAPGTYLNAVTYSSQPQSAPGLWFYGSGGCGGITGQFTISDFAYGTDGSLLRLTATFEQHCGAGSPGLRGKIVYVR
jgi:hypothetical protein